VALALIDSGAADEALKKNQALSAAHPHVSSLDYLAPLPRCKQEISRQPKKRPRSRSQNTKRSQTLWCSFQ